MGARADRRAEPCVKLIRILSVARVAIVPLALAKLLMDRSNFPPGYEAAAWWLLACPADTRGRRPPCADARLARSPPAARDPERRRRLWPHRRSAARLHLGARPAASHSALPCDARGGALLPPARRPARCGAGGADLRGGGAVAPLRVRPPGGDRFDRTPGADRPGTWRHRRASRRHGARPGARRRGACRGSRAAPRRARTAHRRARGHEPRRPRARLLARSRRGFRGFRPGVAWPPTLRSRRDPPRRGKRRGGDGDRRNRGGGIPRSCSSGPGRSGPSRSRAASPRPSGPRRSSS